MRKSNGKASNMVRRTLACALSLAMVVTSLTVTGTSADAAKKSKGKIKSVKVTSPVTNGGKLVLKKGTQKQLKVKVKKSGKISTAVLVKSSNKKVAKIVKKGKKCYVKAVGKKGTAKITIMAKANKKKKATLKVQIGTPIKKVKVASVTTVATQTTITTNKAATPSAVDAVYNSSETLNLKTPYINKVDNYTEAYNYKLNVKYTPSKPTVKKLKWSSSDLSVATVLADGTVVPRAAGSATITAKTTDGSNKQVKVKVNVTKTDPAPTPTPLFETDTREATMVENFESYEVGTKWERKTTGGFANSGTMEVVQDPENPNNKVLKINYNGTDQAYDFAPVLNMKLPDGKTLGDYTAVRMKSRVISNSSDSNYKTIGVYFDGKGTIQSSDYFYTATYEGDDPKKAPNRAYRFGCKISMATGVDMNYNIPESKIAGYAIQNDDMIKYSPLKKYNNKQFPSYYSDYATISDKEAVCPGYSETEYDATLDKKVGFQQNTLELDTDRIGKADISGEDQTPLLQRNELDMVIGSTYAGAQGKEDADYRMILYLDDIEVMSGPIAATAMTIINLPSILYCGDTAGLQLGYTPANATQREVTWISSDETLAKIDERGQITVNTDGKAGSVTFTAVNKATPSVTASTTITIEASAQAAEGDYDVLASGKTSLAPRYDKDPDEEHKIVCRQDAAIDPTTKVMTIKYDSNNMAVVLDLGQEMNLKQYKGIEIAGVVPGQLALEFYGKDFDMTLVEQDMGGVKKSWWDLAAGKTYPFFVASTSYRYEAGGFNYKKSNEMGLTGNGRWPDKKDASPSAETLRYSIDKLGADGTNDWAAIRYIVLKANNGMSLPYGTKWDNSSITENRTTYDYTITSFKFLVDEVMDVEGEGFYNLDLEKNKVADDGKVSSEAAVSATTVTSYYVDNITEENTVEKHDASMNMSDMQYVRVDVENTANVKLSLIEEGKTAAEAVVVGTENGSTSFGSGKRAVYFSLKDIQGVDLKKIDKLCVETDAGATVSKIGMTKGNCLSFSTLVNKVEVQGSTLTEVTLDVYGTEGEKE